MEAVDWVEVYRQSCYGLQLEDGSWRRFTLGSAPSEPNPLPDSQCAELLGKHRSLTLVTAWNPMSEERALEENQAANRALEAELASRNLTFRPASGAALPGVEPYWKEDGFAVFDLDRKEAAALGDAWLQRAVVWLGNGEVSLLFCGEGHWEACSLVEVAKGAP